MIDYAAARAVALVARTGSFEAASRMLSVTPSAISQRVRALEEKIGSVLIERGTPCRPTETGAAICRHMEQVGLLERELLHDLPGLGGDRQETPVLGVATNADSLATWILPALVLHARTAGCLLDIVIDDEAHTADWLRRGRVAAAVTALERPVQGCSVTPLGRLDYVATASPEFALRHFASGVTAGSLERAPVLTHDSKDLLQVEWAKEVAGAALSLPTHYIPSAHAFVEAGLAGLGWALNPQQLVAAHLAAGRLVEIAPGRRFRRSLYWQISRVAARSLAPLSRAVKAAARAALT